MYPDDIASLRGTADLAEPFAALNLLGESPVFRETLRLIRKLAPTDAPVLIHGETGTGKELAAHAIHYLSPRRNGPFIPVNCGAIPDTLVEAELFGHIRGAFTDAREARQGLVARADRGTLFLDEIEAISPRGQVALLRFLQNQEYRPVGDSLVRASNVRVVAATNADIAALARGGQYRQDLLFRLDVLTLELPPLRAREGDALVLARAFVRRFSQQYRRPEKTLHADSVAYIRRHLWPGNVRELENAVLRAFLLCDGPELRLPAPLVPASVSITAASAQPLAPLTATCFRQAKARVIADFERAYITELLARAGGNISVAARLAGKERSRLGKLMRKHGLSGAAFRAATGADAS